MKENIMQAIYKVLMVIVVVAIITFVVISVVNYDNSVKFILPGQDEVSLDEQIEGTISRITKILEEEYIGEINNEDLINGAIKGLVNGLGDEYTEYYTPEDLKAFETSTLGSYVGIGVYLQVDTENNTIKIIDTISDSPAEKAGLKEEDRILKVDGKEYNIDQLDELVDYVQGEKGEEGTEVTLTILRDGKTFDVKVRRDTVHLKYVQSTMLKNNIGYIELTSFDEDCSKDFLDEYNELKKDGAKALIIDLRDNGGGLVDQALEIADLFCDKDETMLITMDKKENKDIKKAKEPQTITMPTILLTNKNTASASEILVAALKENDKAEIVGETTFGKGVIQELIYLSNGGALKVTSAEYYTPNENRINEIGVKPDYEISDIEEQLNKAIELLNK